jgi:RHS repeat-associated protein
MITKRYLTGGINGSTHAYNNTTALVGHTTAFDRTGNKLYERHLEAEDRSHLYQPFNSDGSFAVGYDSANRLRQYQRGVLSSATIPYRVNAGASIATPTTLPGADQVRTYGLDGLGNWKNTNFTEVGSGGSTTSTAETRSHNYVNEITSILDTPPGGTAGTTGFTYDKNGNLLNDGIRIYQYDALNRLVQISKVAEGNPVLATYAYDGLNRRIQKTIADLGGGMGGLTGNVPAGTTNYVNDGQQVALARDGDGNWTQAYFWGRYIDELLFFSIPTETVPTTYRVLSDLLYRSVAIVTTANVVTEAYDCDAYGNTLCYSGPGTDETWFTDDDVETDNPINTTIFTGRLYDPESQVYYYRARYYSPKMGRFISRDPLKDAELSQTSNLYLYIYSNPINGTDMSGLEADCISKDCKEVSRELEVSDYDFYGGSSNLKASGEQCSCCPCGGSSFDVGITYTLTLGLGFSKEKTVGGFRKGYHLIGPRFASSIQLHYVKECGEDKGVVRVNQVQSIPIQLSFGGGLGIIGFDISAGGTGKIEYGIEADSTGVDAYINFDVDMSVSATLSGGKGMSSVNTTFTHYDFDKSSNFKTPKLKW